MNNIKTATVSVGDLLDCVKGEMLNCSDKSEEVVENLMVGAMCVDPAPLYFNLKANKAVITRGDRTDIQLGALETSIKCLILTGGHRPIQAVLQRADEKEVPVIVVQEDTPSVLAKLEQGFSQILPAEPESEGESVEADQQQ